MNTHNLSLHNYTQRVAQTLRKGGFVIQWGDRFPVFYSSSADASSGVNGVTFRVDWTPEYTAGHIMMVRDSIYGEKRNE